MWNNNVANAIKFVTGLAENGIIIAANVALSSPASTYTIAGIGLDSTTAVYRAAEAYIAPAALLAVQISFGIAIAPQFGYHSINLLENSSGGSASFGNGQLAGQVVA